MSVRIRIDTPLGPLVAVGGDGGLRWLAFDDGERPAPPGAPAAEPGVLAATRRQLAEYFAGVRTTFELPLSAGGTPFQQRVWRTLAAIPYGETVSYRELAAAIGAPGAARAVGLANGRNPISIVVPCHRVIGADGRLTGYGGGLERKRALLELERRGGERSQPASACFLRPSAASPTRKSRTFASAGPRSRIPSTRPGSASSA